MTERHDSELTEKEGMGRMFDSIAWRYDFLNHLLSFGIDRRWRKRAVKEISGNFRNPEILDVATGTGDLAIEAAGINPVKITGIDISENMLKIGQKKVAEKNLENLIEFVRCESENICFDDESFDVAMVAFGVRNFTDPVRGLSEMRRVLRTNGMIVVLEFSRPGGTIFKHLYNIYFGYVLPFIGSLFSKHRKAYKYLNESVMRFAEKEEFISMMTSAGFSDISQTRMTGGIASIYTGVRK
ncbi:MAG TPA: bifunctional demethylmenaquinone methyltransferase/2-methoxy-6-polyprenyl-1,4-benzoquinol methylase UbiE [Bacteroidales bacterium]|nr:bifunctional demethylmenaquinone methyltransferase/2-methoxy-6-polyprenyl-1,4-benzoquinol methylase UbiE [Bacteroidales bacterium]